MERGTADGWREWSGKRVGICEEFSVYLEMVAKSRARRESVFGSLCDACVGSGKRREHKGDERTDRWKLDSMWNVAWVGSRRA